MKIFKSMFTTKPVNENTQSSKTTEDKRTYREWGMQSAGGVYGSLTALLPCLQSVYCNITKKIEGNEEIKEERRKQISQQISILTASKENIDNKLQAEKDKLKYEESKIENLKKEIDSIRQNPQQITEDKFVKASFWIGLLIIFFLTVYLFVFYSSAAYSAFFKNFNPDDINILNSIFDSQALSKAWTEGLSELIFILTIPAVFLGLGFLIHKFQEQKKIANYFKVAGLILTTLIFDCILAYEIVKKIYDVQRAGSFESLPVMTVSMIFEQINFWLIIFAGFVVYLIWGFVFDFVMNEYAKLDKVKYAIRTREKNISEYKIECKNIRNAIQRLDTEQSEHNGKINTLQVELSGVRVRFNDVKEGINEFFTGWIAYMQGAGQALVEVKECEVIRDNFINELQQSIRN